MLHRATGCYVRWEEQWKCWRWTVSRGLHVSREISALWLGELLVLVLCQTFMWPETEGWFERYSTLRVEGNLELPAAKWNVRHAVTLLCSQKHNSTLGGGVLGAVQEEIPPSDGPEERGNFFICSSIISGCVHKNYDRSISGFFSSLIKTPYFGICFNFAPVVPNILLLRRLFHLQGTRFRTA
jgi:hypothetical protein